GVFAAAAVVRGMRPLSFDSSRRRVRRAGRHDGSMPAPVSALWQRLEAPAEDAKTLHRRTNLLVAIHLVLAITALAVLALVFARIRLLVTLTQRSNVETLVIAFVVVFLVYLLVTTLPATIGALRLLGYRSLGHDRAQRALQHKARNDRKETKRCHLNVVVRGPRGGDVSFPIVDDYGTICDVNISR